MDKGIARALFSVGIAFSGAVAVGLVALASPTHYAPRLLLICGCIALTCFIFLGVGIAADWFHRLPDNEDHED